MKRIASDLLNVIRSRMAFILNFRALPNLSGVFTASLGECRQETASKALVTTIYTGIPGLAPQVIVLRTTVDGRQETTVADDAELYRQLRADRPAASVGYVTDVGFSAANRQRLQGLLADVSLLCCECTFLAEDVDKARASRHLCTRDVNQLAADLRPRTLLPLHLSKSYVRNPRALYRELTPPPPTRLLELPDYVTARPLLLTALPRFDHSAGQADTLPCLEVSDA